MAGTGAQCFSARASARRCTCEASAAISPTSTCERRAVGLEVVVGEQQQRAAEEAEEGLDPRLHLRRQQRRALYALSSATRGRLAYRVDRLVEEELPLAVVRLAGEVVNGGLRQLPAHIDARLVEGDGEVDGRRDADALAAPWPCGRPRISGPTGGRTGVRFELKAVRVAPWKCFIIHTAVR